MSRHNFAVRATKTANGFEVDRDRFRKLAQALPDGAYLINVEKESRLGVQQRKYYFAVIVATFAEYWGVDDDDAHDLLKLHCNTKVVEVTNKQTGEVSEEKIGASTAGFTTEQWSLYIERCQRWAATDFGVVIPDPDPEWMFNAA